MKTRTILYADEGMVLTNGTNYGKQIILGSSDNAEDYYEITDAEYEVVMAKQEETVE